MGMIIPSIWTGSYSSYSEFRPVLADESGFRVTTDFIDDGCLVSRKPFNFSAHCAACGTVTSMTMTWSLCGEHEGAVHPAWTEVASCRVCTLNSRMRALYTYLTENSDRNSSVYVAEKVTPFYKLISKLYSNIESSEYVAPGLKSDEYKSVGPLPFNKVRHEDLTALSFQDESFDVVITQDVFEHIPEYGQALKECYRVLRKGGTLIFTIPFNYLAENTIKRAVVREDGEIEHLLPPEIHGNPVSSKGSLCFQNFGWDLLELGKRIGFSSTTANSYWGPWAGHMGTSFFVFDFRKD